MTPNAASPALAGVHTSITQDSRRLLAIFLGAMALLAITVGNSAHMAAQYVPWLQPFCASTKQSAVDHAIVSSLARLTQHQWRLQRMQFGKATSAPGCPSCRQAQRNSSQADFCACSAVVIITQQRALPYVQVLLASLLESTIEPPEIHVLNTEPDPRHHSALQQLLQMFPSLLQAHNSHVTTMQCTTRSPAWRVWECQLAHQYLAALKLCQQVCTVQTCISMGVHYVVTRQCCAQTGYGSSA